MAIHFKNTQHHYFITTNLKVWFSTLTYHKELVRISNSEIFRNLVAKKVFPPAAHKHYYLVRNPYDRLESFYRDKLFHSPSTAVASDEYQWQYCQDLFISAFGNPDWSFDEKRNFLLSISFEDFITALSDIYLFDPHIFPQREQFKIRFKHFFLNLKFDKILKVEDETTLDFLKNNLKIDTSIKRNFTQELKVDLIWNNNMREIVNTLYEADFENFGYKML